MTALITSIIPAQNFELIRDQIRAILLLELTNQGVLDNTFIVPSIWCERMTIFDKEELPSVNICLYKGDYERKSRLGTHGTYTYLLEVYTNSATTNENPGDKLAAQKMQRIIGKILAILGNPAYETLGFSRSVISGIEHTEISSFKIDSNGEVNDALYSTKGTIAFMVKVPEGVQLGSGNLCTLANSVVTLEETTNGYQYQFPQS